MNSESILIGILEPCRFVAVRSSECPSDFGRGLAECSSNMASNQLCEADNTLPGGNTNFEVNNCGPFDDLNYDVFKCIKGIRSTHN